MNINVIFVVLNDLNRLKKSIEKLCLLKKKDEFRIIIIDGKSEDKTDAFLKEEIDSIDIWISEPDQGIYDAMNKGINLAKNDWSIFINAGDVIADDTVLDKIGPFLTDEFDVIYGDTIIKYPDFNILKKSRLINQLWKGMIFSHQSVFIRTPLLKNNKFDLKYKIGADYDQLFRLYKQNKRFKYVPIPISIIESNGISDQKILKSWFEHFKILKSYEQLSLKMIFYHLFLFFFLVGLKIVRKIMLRKFYFLIIKMIYKKRLVTVTGS